MKYKAIIFDLDGVIVSTDDCHYEAWKKLADEENISFDRKTNDRLRGVSRMESLEIILEKSQKNYTAEEKNEMASRKNGYYVDKIMHIDENALLAGAMNFVISAKKAGLKVAIGSSSKNTKIILSQTKCNDIFDAVADGNDIKLSKPAPDVFLKAAEKLMVLPEECLVVEDADAGIEAALNAGMDVLAVGAARFNEKATYGFFNLKEAYENDFIKGC